MASRLTTHAGRYHKTKSGKRRPYSRKHPDRNFDKDNVISNPDNIDFEKTGNDRKYICANYANKDLNADLKKKTIDEWEHFFYEHKFKKSLDKKNRRKIENREFKKVKTSLDILNSVKTCPEETIFQLGRYNNETERYEGYDADTLLEAYQRYRAWHIKRFPQIKILDYTLHVDETSPHIHERKVYMFKDAEGDWDVGQDACLEQMGFELPEPNKKKSKKNNRKIAYTKECRDKMLEICQEMGLDIIKEPDRENCGKSHYAYMMEQEMKKQEAITKDLQDKLDKLETIKEDLELIQGRIPDEDKEWFEETKSDLEETKRSLGHSELLKKYQIPEEEEEIPEEEEEKEDDGMGS